MAIPYYNPSFAASPDAPLWRSPGRSRPILAHFRGRVMNRVRATLVKTYGKRTPSHVVEAAHPSTAARCNLDRCSAKAFAFSGSKLAARTKAGAAAAAGAAAPGAAAGACAAAGAAAGLGAGPI